MDKSIASEDYRVFLRELRTARKRSGLTQVDLAAKIGETQSFVSKCERGERRLDVVEVRAICQAIGSTLSAFAGHLDKVLSREPSKKR